MRSQFSRVNPNKAKKINFFTANSFWSSAPDDLARKVLTGAVSLVLHTSTLRTEESFADSGQRCADSDHKNGVEALRLLEVDVLVGPSGRCCLIRRRRTTRHADFQSGVGMLLALYLNKLAGRPLPNLHHNA